tara:strand:- start:200 stop:1243 length:1044 start_codon:yes stop_codon:yes gene_type:complete
MDSFYASIEKREDPQLEYQPVIVVQGPKEGRGVVAACSYEAREYGVRSGMPLQTAKKLCPEAIYKDANHDLYEETSIRIMDILRQHTDKFQPVSIDEAYLDITSRADDYREAEKIAKKIKRIIKRKENLTSSIGIAPNKTIAKIASANRKPDGITIVTPEKTKIFLNPLPVEKLPGVGKKTAQELRKIGIKTIHDIVETPKVTLVERFGKNGVWIWDIANGIDETPVEESEEIKSISKERTLEEDTNNWATINKTINSIINEAHRRTEDENYLFRTIGITLTFEDFQKITRSKTLQKHTSSNQIMQENVRQLLKEFEQEPRRIRRIGVRISNLKLKEETEPSLDKYI